MYAREGYVSLSRLWRDFESRFSPLCKERALACMKADPHSSDFVFGTALDLCEDVFLRTFDTCHLSLVPLQGEVVLVEPVLAHSGARLLLKSTAYESALISIHPDESGPNGKWLRQMGSSAFCAADSGWLWPDKMGRGSDVDLENVLFANEFHTLPILFERPAYVIAQELPPWSNDLLEESYVRNVWHQTRGSSICLSDATKEVWNKLLTKQYVETILNDLVPRCSPDAVPTELIGGRPRKLPEVIGAYQELGLMKEKLSRKEELRRVGEHLNDVISPSTLDRARRALKVINDKDGGEQG